jgi:hypothetical protein
LIGERRVAKLARLERRLVAVGDDDLAGQVRATLHDPAAEVDPTARKLAVRMRLALAAMDLIGALSLDEAVARMAVEGIVLTPTEIAALEAGWPPERSAAPIRRPTQPCSASAAARV